jgi:hypothetical protein
MKASMFFGLVCVLTLPSVKSQTIAAARAAAVGSTVTIKGIVTNGSELGNIRYIQDATAGLPAFGSGLSSVAVGDSITVTGPTTLFNNLLEILPVNSFTVHASGKPLPSPNVITPSTFDESVEGTLIRINNGVFSATGNFAGNTNYTVTSSAQTFVVRVAVTATSIVGTAIPSGPVDIIGMASQFCTSPTTGCTVGYQLYPRTLADIISSPTSINEFNSETSALVYPNPSSDMIYIKSSSLDPIVSVNLSDVQGRVIYSSEGNIKSLDVSALAQGVYTISIVTAKNICRSKLCIE